MIAKLNLETIASKLAEKVETKAQLDNKFKLEYIIPEMKEQILLDEGFVYVGQDNFNKCPLYQKENIYGLFLTGSFRLGEGTFVSEEEYNEIKKKEE